MSYVYSQDGPFVWDESMQSFILGSFFYGYVITQIPAGYLAGQKLVSSKWILGIGILMTSIFTVLMPWAAKTNYYFLLAVRVLEGKINNIVVGYRLRRVILKQILIFKYMKIISYYI